MPATYADFYREPSKPHQCMHESEQDGTRCRATAMHNELMCFHHRSDDIPTVIQNAPFLLENLDTRAAIQRALGELAARLACNQMDFQRARLLLTTIQSAMRNLPPHPRTAAAAPNPAHSTETAPTHNAVISTKGDALVAAGEETPHLSSPPAPNPPNPAPANPKSSPLNTRP